MPPSWISFKHKYTHTWLDKSHSIYYGPRHWRHFSRSQSHCCSHHEAAISEGTPHTPHPAITAAHATLWPMNAHITTHAGTTTCIVASHPTLATSPTDITHTTPQTRAGLIWATPTTLHRKCSQEKPSYVQDLQSPINLHCSQTVTIQDSPFWFFIRFREYLWSFKLLEPSPSSDEDEQGGHSSNNHYTIGLVSDSLK